MWFGPTRCAAEHSVKTLMHFLIMFFISFYLKNPMIRRSKMKYETVLKDETSRSERTGEEQRTSMNNIVANDIAR